MRIFSTLASSFPVAAILLLTLHPALLRAAPAPVGLQSEALNRARQTRRGRAPILLVVRPTLKETYAAQVAFAGATDPNAKVLVNGHAVRVYPTGAFAGLVDLSPGDNTIVIEARNEDGATVERRNLKRLPTTPPPLPSEAPAIAGDRPMQPDKDIALAPGGWISLSFIGSPGLHAEYRIGESAWRPLREARKDGKPTGLYEAAYRLQPGDAFDQAPVRFRLTQSAESQKTKVAQADAPGRVTAIDPGAPAVMEITQHGAALFTSPAGRARMANLPKGVRLSVIGRVGDRVKTRLSETLSAWVRSQDGRMLPDGEPLPIGRNNTIETTANDAGATVTLDLGARAPVVVHESLQPPGARLTVYGAEARAWWTHRAMPDKLLGEVAWSLPEDEVAEVSVALRAPQPWGFAIRYDEKDQLHWTLFSPPVLKAAEDARLKGLSITLDPGHGGRDSGAIGATGLLEKNVNLALARLLAARLRRAGAQVALTRDKDVFVLLEDRVGFALESHSNLFISLHGNSADDMADPLLHRGSLVIDYHPHSRPLSEKICARLASLNPPEGRLGIVQADYQVVRDLTQMPAILIEAQYITHPEDEARLMDGKFLDSFAEGIYKGVVDYAQTLTAP